MKKSILMLCFAAFGFAAQAQDLRGAVRDADNQPLVGASVYWAGTTVGTSTDAAGEYQLHRVKGYDRLVASYLGFVNDTLQVAGEVPRADFALQAEGVDIENVVIEGTMSGNFAKHDGIVKQEMISFAGLCKMACCNLAESFENSASVTVGYSDAVTGARQIKMLGLAGTYTQILDENRTIMRGLSSPYGLSYTPGMWLSSIQVSKGVASVTAGHEAITGQINLEYRKPTDDERLFLNFYTDEELRFEGNVASSIPVTRDKKLTTVILAHGSTDTDLREMSAMDRNRDGFRDMPEANQINVANRWLYAADNGMQIRWGAKFVDENRLGGMLHYKPSMRGGMPLNGMYGSEVKNRDANAYVKIGMPVGAAVYDPDEQDEMRSNVAVVADYSYYDTDSYFGRNTYGGTEHIGSFNAMYSHYFSYRNSMIFGLTGLYRTVDERAFKTLGEGDALRTSEWTDDYTEREIGAYTEYTYSVKDKFSLVAGVRADYNSHFDRWLLTPRGHIRWSITPSTTLRASAGLGYRAANIISDNIGIMATGRVLDIDPVLDRMEKALTWGGSLMQTFHIVGDDSATLSFDFFRTSFYNSVVVSQELGDAVSIYATGTPSYTNTYQVDFNWTPLERFDIFATFRYTDSAVTLEHDGLKKEVERPLVGRYKTLLNLQYATRFRRWTFDVTAQYNGPCRLPYLDGSVFDEGYRAVDSPAYPVFFAQVTRKVGKFDIYVGCENIADYRQKDPILHGDAPFSQAFNSSVVWGPLMGRKIYAGVRFNLY